MKFYFSLETVPELSGLSNQQRRTARMYYQQTEPVTRAARVIEDALVGAIILAEIVGTFAGAILWQAPFWGPVVGGVIALALVMCVFYFGTLCLAGPKFRRFLQTDHGQFMLRSIKAPEGSPAKPLPPPPEAGAEILCRYREDDGIPIKEEEMLQALNKVTYDMARSSEVMELSEELANESLRLSKAAQERHQEAWRAFKSLRLGRWHRLSRECVELQGQAFRILRQSGELLQGGEAAIGIAKALLAKVEKEIRR